MARSPSFCGVILAAGESSRMGRDKALLPWRDSTFLGGAIDLLAPLTDMVIVVGGNNAPNLEPLVYAASAFLIVNREPERGQFSSLRLGLQEVMNHGRDAAIVALVDRPPARPDTVALLKDRFLERASEGIWAVVPRHGERNGHPVVVGREMINALLSAPPTVTARDVEHAHLQRIEYVSVDDPLVVWNVDTPEDYRRITSG
ncbi:MAG: nucleotidyltransferase family protein [Acidobacteriia bacterium]|nr:nucleotidyltransferase family protein [Terriglobia bacterium]